MTLPAPATLSTDRRTPEEILQALHEHEAFVSFLYPRWGQHRYKIHSPDALELRWTVWDADLQRTFSYGTSPVDAVTSARARINHEQCAAYKDAA